MTHGRGLHFGKVIIMPEAVTCILLLTCLVLPVPLAQGAISEAEFYKLDSPHEMIFHMRKQKLPLAPTEQVPPPKNINFPIWPNHQAILEANQRTKLLRRTSEPGLY